MMNNLEYGSRVFKVTGSEEPKFDGRVWNTLGERGSLLAGEGWRYTPNGQVRHMTDASLIDGGGRRALCGIAARAEYWRGTGSQDEYEWLGRKPKCLSCMRRMKCGRTWLVTPLDDCLVPACGCYGDPMTDTGSENLYRPCGPCGLKHARSCVARAPK